MGCKQSTTATITVRNVTSAGGKVAPMDAVPSPQKGTIIITDYSPAKTSKKSLRSVNNSASGSLESLACSDCDETGNHGSAGSAGSKRSQRSADSGLGGADPLSHFITEYSDSSLVRKVEDEFVENDGLDLSITGVACPRRQSTKDKDRLEEQRILAVLREEGLITGPKSRAAGGLAFEITEDDDGGMRRPPRLVKLERISRKKTKSQLTQEQIKEKLEKAEQRRKRKEAERLQRINQLEKSTKQAIDTFELQQKEKEEAMGFEQRKKIDLATDNRQKQMAERKEKQRMREERAILVRQRKEISTDNMSTDNLGFNHEDETTLRDNDLVSHVEES